MRKFLYSPGWGGDWSLRQYNDEVAKLYLFDEAIIAFVEAGGTFTYEEIHSRIVPFFSDPDEGYVDYSVLHPLLADLYARILAVDTEEYPMFGGAMDLVVGTCPDGVRFRITGYDGNESFILDTTPQRWF